ncbi:type IIL restriction-modification enzyme MmeI [Microvirga pudoricolor]|uniref:type IIL restriction-modification enzyme MmeI n=1 Tax=Microvirga pudoricolor TaxID=2778729 RepID=UPI00194FB3BB|nr:type IIL restriction-modification enzyme MmeI [Microvirga pudoricolor]MBM6596614.1 hypothetical protein [Microvirga pudoricolor]
MTVAEKGEREGGLHEVVRESGLETDEPVVELRARIGRINADLTVGVDVTRVSSLLADKSLAYMGYKLHGQGFVIDAILKNELTSACADNAEQIVRPYMNGKDLVQGNRSRYALDLYPLGQDTVRKEYPKIYQHLLTHVKPERDQNREQFRRENWWWFGRTHASQRDALCDLDKYIGTARTAKHRIFSFLESNVISESKIVIIASDDPAVLGILSSRIHIVYSLRTGGWLGAGNDPTYNHTECFETFPFPDPPDSLKAQIRAVAEELDAFRKSRQAEHPKLTLTQMYNVLEKLKVMEAARRSSPSSLWGGRVAQATGVGV